MLIDGRELPAGHTLVTDVCIIGGGPAGIAVALELVGSGLGVCLVEGGGFEGDHATQRLYRGRSVGHVYFRLDTCRVRHFGGSSNRWGGWCRPLDPMDFERRSWVPESGWPFGSGELAPFYRRAESLCQLTSGDYDGPTWAGRAGYGPFHLPPAEFTDEVFQFSPPTLFGAVYREALLGAANITTLLHGNVVELEVEPGSDAIRAARLRSFGGAEARITARTFVLAVGGIETPRLLLASNRVRPAGLGNQHDLVGRYFMEHPHLATGHFLPSSLAYDNRFFEKRPAGSAMIKGVLVPSPALAERDGLLGISISPEPPEYSVGDLFNAWPRRLVLALTRLQRLSQETRAYALVRRVERLLHRVRSTSPDTIFARQLQSALETIDQDGADPGSRRSPPGGSYRLYCRSEQVPNRDSRVTLSTDRDALGVPRAVLDWRLAPLDLHTIRTCVTRFGAALGAAGIGRVKLPADWDDDRWPERIVGGPHHMGTTRMADAPARGVVDRHCRVHETGNLYLAGSSVFPTSGYANPTLTLIALAIRLGDHLRRRGV